MFQFVLAIDPSIFFLLLLLSPTRERTIFVKLGIFPRVSNQDKRGNFESLMKRRRRYGQICKNRRGLDYCYGWLIRL